MRGALGRQFYDVEVECPYGLARMATYRQAYFGSLPAGAMELFLEAGFRRNGNSIYTMVCKGCQACVPIRLEPARLRLNRSQRRVKRRNQDLDLRLGPLTITSQKLALCDKFLNRRFPSNPGNAAFDYYAGFFVNSLGFTQELEFWSNGRLLGVSVIDLHLAAINCVYFYFDPDCGPRGLGVNNILTLADYALTRRIPHLYLGYWIGEVTAMRYKARFNPHSLLIDGQWQEQPRFSP